MSFKSSYFSLSRVLIILSPQGLFVQIFNYIFYIVAFVQFIYLNLLASRLDQNFSIFEALKNFTGTFMILSANLNSLSFLQIIVLAFEALLFIMIILAINLGVEAEHKRISSAIKVYVLKGFNFALNTILFIPLMITLKNASEMNLESDSYSIFLNILYSKTMIISLIVLSNLYLLIINRIGFDFRSNESNYLGKSSNMHEIIFQLLRIGAVYSLNLNQYIWEGIAIVSFGCLFSHLRHHQPFFDKFEQNIWDVFALEVILLNTGALAYGLLGIDADTFYTSNLSGLLFFILLESTHRPFVEDTILSVFKPVKDSEKIHRRMRLIPKRAFEIGIHQSPEALKLMILAARSEINNEKLEEARRLDSTADEDQMIFRLKLLFDLREKIDDEFRLPLQVSYCYYLFEKCFEKIECLNHCNMLLTNTSRLKFNEELKINFYRATLEEELMSDSPQLTIGIRVPLD